jgi:hypothetical protein
MQMVSIANYAKTTFNLPSSFSMIDIFSESRLLGTVLGTMRPFSQRTGGGGKSERDQNTEYTEE